MKYICYYMVYIFKVKTIKMFIIPIFGKKCTEQCCTNVLHIYHLERL